MNDISQDIPRISLTLEDKQVEHQPTMLEIEGTIPNQIVCILIDLRAILSYIIPQIVEECKLKTYKFINVWLVQL